MRYKPYKLPIVVRNKNGDWYVKYFYEYPDQPGEFKEFRVRDGVNRLRDPKQKEAEIQRLCHDIAYSLREGIYSPFGEEKHISEQLNFGRAAATQIAEDRKYQPWTLMQALDAYRKWMVERNLSGRTQGTYSTYLNNFEAWLKDNDLEWHPACDYTERDLMDFLNFFYEEEEWTPRTYNNHAHFFAGFFNRASKLEKKINREIKYSVDMSDFDDKIDRSEKNKYYNDKLAEAIKKELKNPLRDFVAWIYLSCMRPKELRFMKVGDIDLSSRQIRIGSYGKTSQRLVPICNELEALILRMGLDQQNQNFYVFGKDGKPGPEQVWRFSFSERYAKIKKKFDLDHNYTMYSWKHTRVVNLIRAGFTDREVMQLTGHRDVKSFEAYKRDLLLDPNSRMTRKTIDF